MVQATRSWFSWKTLGLLSLLLLLYLGWSSPEVPKPPTTSPKILPFQTRTSSRYTKRQPIPTQPNPNRQYVVFQNWRARFSNWMQQSEILAPPEIGEINNLRPDVNDDYLITTEFFRHHMDARYGSLDISRDQQQVVEKLGLLFQAWSRFCEQQRLLWWIAHGTLIGWSFNQKILPWDADIDVQTTTHELLTNFLPLNQTIFEEKYLFDVNKHCFYRQPQHGNQIDARFIDMTSGLYVDITGLSKTPHGSLQCKSPHSYAVSDIFPLQESTFEGVTAYLPSQVAKILSKEYGERVALPAFHPVSKGQFFVFQEEENQWKLATRPQYVNTFRKFYHTLPTGRKIR